LISAITEVLRHIEISEVTFHLTVSSSNHNNGYQFSLCPFDTEGRGEEVMKFIKILQQGLTAKSLLGVAMAVSMVGVTHAAAIDVNTSAYGNTWGEWSARWVQWALSIPAATNPILDPDGENCELGQSGSVWFLAGTGGGCYSYLYSASRKGLVLSNRQRNVRCGGE
jgi:hypothetical protein